MAAGSVARSSVVAFRTLAAVFAVVAAYAAALFVSRLGEEEIRSGVLLIAFFAATAAVGLWRLRRWGRSLALLVALANAGLGALALLAAILDQRSATVGPALFFAANAGLAYALTRRLFGLPDDV